VNKKLLSLYGLKWNPFSPELPVEALVMTPRIELFAWRIENMTREGGFALVTGPSGAGKSVALRLVAEQLSRNNDLSIAELSRPQARLSDFYRELGHMFGVPLTPNNRWGGSSSLRDKWLAHMDTTRLRPVLLIDEAQETHSSVLNELRLLSSSNFDSRNLLTVVLCGDQRLLTKLQEPELVPLASRIRPRLLVEPQTPAELCEHLTAAITTAGNAKLMTSELVSTIAEHAAGNWRSMMTTAHELLAAGLQQEAPRLDEKLYLDVFSAPPRQSRRPRKGSR